MLTLQHAMLSTGSPVDHGHRLTSYDTSLVVSGGVDCGRRRRSVYDKKPHRYAKYNRAAHLTACSDKSVAYVTNNKRLYQGRSDGGYIGIYTPKISNRFVHVWDINTSFETAMTS